MKKIVYLILAGIIGAVVGATISFLFFAGYGGNVCNMYYINEPNSPNSLIPVGSCDCFCCQMFNLSGYESCGIFGFLLGIFVGAILGPIIVSLAWNKSFSKK